MHPMIGSVQRDALYDALLTDLTAVGDIYTALANDDVSQARRLRRRFEADLRLLDDLGWSEQSQGSCFSLTMPRDELRAVIERIYWRSQSVLALPAELDHDALERVRQVCVSCPEILSRLTEDCPEQAAPSAQDT